MSYFTEPSEPGPDTPVDELLTMLTASSISTGIAAVEKLDTLYPDVPIDAIITILQKETLSPSVLKVLFPLLKRCNVHVSQDILLTALKECKKHKDVELLRQLEWELISRGAESPIEELLQMLFECRDDLYDHYQPFFTQVGHILGQLSAWVTPENLFTSSNTENHGLMNSEDQCAAIDILAALKDFLPIAPKLIMSALEDPQQKQEVRGHILFTLQEIGETVPLPYLLLGLDWCYQGMQEMMEEMMTRLGEQAPIQELIGLLDHTNNWTRGSAATSLCNLAQYVPISSLINAITHGSPWMRKGAVQVMGACGDRAPISVLIELARNKDEILEVRRAAWLALGRLGRLVPLEVFLERVPDEQEFIENYVVYALIMRGNGATLDEIPVLLNVLVAEVDLRNALLNVLSTFEEPALIKLLMSIIQYKQLYKPTKLSADSITTIRSMLLKQKLHFSEPASTPYAFAALEMLRRYVPLDTLITNLYNDLGHLSGPSFEALIAIGKYDSLEEVVAHLDMMEDNRADVVEILGSLGEYAPLDILLRLLDDHDSKVQLYASVAFYKLAEAMSTKIIARTYEDTRQNARVVLLIALEHSGEDAPDEAINLAKELLSDDGLCGRALLTLNHLGKTSEIPLEFLLQALQRDIPRWIVLEALEQFGSQVPLDLLLPLLGDHNKSVYQAAIRTIAKTHPDTIHSLIVPQIEAILQGKPTGEIFAASVQRRIAYRIGWMESVTPPLITLLIELLDYPYLQVRLEAVRTLGKIHPTLPDRARLHLMELRNDPQSQAMREAASEALAAIPK